MYIDAEERLNEFMDQNEKDGPSFLIKIDPRIIRIATSYKKRY